MIPRRAGGSPRIVTRPVALGLASLMLVAQPVVIIGVSGGTGSAAAAPAGQWDAQALPALAGSDETGPRLRELEGVTVDMMANAVATTTTPTLLARLTDSANGRRVQFRILDANGTRVLSQSGQITIAQAQAQWRVPRAVLVAGRAYRMELVDAANVRTAVIAPRPLTVDIQRADEQQLHGFAGVNVAKVTGAPVLMFSSPGVTTLSGTAGFQLNYRPGNAKMAGLPGGWRMNPSGPTSRWTTLTLTGANTATVARADGFSVTYTRSGARGAFVPMTGPHHDFPGGGYADLFQNDDGSFTIIDVNQMVTTYPAPPAGAYPASLHPNRSWTEGSPSLQQSWRGDRLSVLTDSVSGRRIRLFYGGSTRCAAPAPGFIAAPKGMLCASTDWAGQWTRISYVSTPAGPQVGRITIQAQAGSGAEVTDIGWDASGRPAALRQPLAAAAVASGVVGGLGPQDARATTQIAYDQFGRVRQITPPASLVGGQEQTDAQQARPAQSFAYGPPVQGTQTLTITQEGFGGPFVEQSVANLATMDQTMVVGPDGCRMRTTFDADDNATMTENTCDGTRSQTRYDASGLPVASVGPTRRALTDRQAPKMQTAYDTTKTGRTSRRAGDPARGLMMVSFDNDRFAGSPAFRTIGPSVAGRTPDRMALNFPANPSGADGPWSARISGDYLASQKGEHRFLSRSRGVRLFVEGRECAPRECTVPLAKGQRAHIQASVESPGGGAEVTLEVASPGRALQVIPASATRPALQQPTEQWIEDETALGGAAQSLKESLEYDNEAGGNLIRETSSQGTTVSYRWDTYDPARGKFGQRTGWVNPRGMLTREAYFGPTQKATTCASKVVQGGLLRSTTPTGAPADEQVYDAAGRTAKATGAGTQMCVARDAAGQATSGAVSSPGTSSYAISNDPMRGGNPLIAAGTTTAQGVTTSALTEISITGAPHRITDTHGTVSTYAYDPATGSPTQVTERTATGQERIRTFRYDALGRLTQMAVNGVVLQTVTYRNDGFPLRVDYANGTFATLELDQNNNLTARTYSGFAGGVSVGEQSVFSRGGSVLGRTLSGPDGTAEFSYAYNKDHRLTLSSVSGTMPLGVRSSRVAFTGPSGANGNRQQQTRVATDGTTSTWTFSYDGTDRLISSTKPGVNPLDYDATGRAVRVGATALAYDAGGNLTSLTSPEGQMAFLGNGDAQYRPSGGAPVTLRQSGDLLLDQDGMIEGQVIALMQGVSVALDASGQPVAWNYQDLQGSTAWSTTGNAAPSGTTVYDPWGEQISTRARPAPATARDLAMSMQGWAGTGRMPIGDDLYTMGARAYAPRSGRFVQPDPVVGGSLNRYEFAAGDPLNNRDASGQLTTGRWAAIGISIGIAAVAALTVKFGGVALLSVKKGAIVGGVTGATSGAVSSTVQQGVDNGWDAIDWRESVQAAAIGGTVGAAVGGLSAKVALSKQSAAQAAAQNDLGFARRQLHWAMVDQATMGGTGVQAAQDNVHAVIDQITGAGMSVTTKGGSAQVFLADGTLTPAHLVVATAPLPTGLASAGFFVAGSGTPVTPFVGNVMFPSGPPAPDPGSGTPEDGTYDAGSAGGAALRSVVGG